MKNYYNLIAVLVIVTLLFITQNVSAEVESSGLIQIASSPNNLFSINVTANTEGYISSIRGAKDASAILTVNISQGGVVLASKSNSSTSNNPNITFSNSDYSANISAGIFTITYINTGPNNIYNITSPFSFTGSLFSINNQFPSGDNSGNDGEIVFTSFPGPPIVALNSPANGYSSINRTVVFNVSVNDSINNIASVKLFIDGVSNITNVSGVKGIYLFTLNLSAGFHNWSIGATNSIGLSTNSSTRTFNITEFVLNSQTYNSTTTETFTESFIANITLAPGNSLTSANLIYNGTSYTGSISSSGDNRILSRTIIIPNVTATSNITFYWSLTLNNGTTYIQNTTSTIQLVNDLSIDNCLINTVRILNYTIYDEDNRFKLKNTSYNLSSNVYVKISGDFSGQNYQYYSGNTSANSINICVANSLIQGQNYRLDSIVQYTANDYVTEYHYIENFTLTNATIPQNISLYLLASNRSQEFLITFKNSDLIPVEGAIIELTRQYLSLGQFLSVEIMKTDNDGRTIGHFVLNDEVYTIYVKVNGEVVAVYENVRAFCSDIITGDCRINLNQQSSTNNPRDFRNYLGISGSESYNDNTKTYTFSFSSNDASSKTINVTVYKYDAYLNQTICNDVLISSSGTINCVIPSTYYNNSALVNVYVDGELYSSSIFSITISKASELNPSRYFLGFLLLISLPLLAVSSGVLMLILFLVGLIVAVGLALIDLGGFIGPGLAFIWFVIAVCIILYKVNKEENR